MNSPLRESWTKRLDAASLDSSWSARIEEKVLRFLLQRYAGSGEEAPVPRPPLYEGESPEGEAKAPHTPVSRSRTLRRIAQGNFEAHNEPVDSLLGDRLVSEAAYRDLKSRQRAGRRSTFSSTMNEYFPGVKWLYTDFEEIMIKAARRFLLRSSTNKNK